MFFERYTMNSKLSQRQFFIVTDIVFLLRLSVCLFVTAADSVRDYSLFVSIACLSIVCLLFVCLYRCFPIHALALIHVLLLWNM